jgi:hypothetical protein
VAPDSSPFVWNVSPEDLDAWAVALRHSVATRTHTGYFAAVACFYDWLVVRQAGQIENLIGISVRNPVDRFNRARRLSEGERLVPVPRESHDPVLPSVLPQSHRPIGGLRYQMVAGLPAGPSPCGLC